MESAKIATVQEEEVKESEQPVASAPMEPLATTLESKDAEDKLADCEKRLRMTQDCLRTTLAGFRVEEWTIDAIVIELERKIQEALPSKKRKHDTISSDML